MHLVSRTSLDKILYDIQETKTLMFPRVENLLQGLFEAHCLAYELRGLPVVEFSPNLYSEIEWSAYQVYGMCVEHKKQHKLLYFDKHYVPLLAQGIVRRYNGNTKK